MIDLTEFIIGGALAAMICIAMIIPRDPPRLNHDAWISIGMVCLYLSWFAAAMIT